MSVRTFQAWICTLCRRGPFTSLNEHKCDEDARLAREQAMTAWLEPSEPWPHVEGAQQATAENYIAAARAHAETSEAFRLEAAEGRVTLLRDLAQRLAVALEDRVGVCPCSGCLACRELVAEAKTRLMEIQTI